jgi:hypothetical protein
MPEDAGEGIFEQSLESCFVLAPAKKQIGLVVGYCVVIAGLNMSGMMVTSFSSAIHRNIYEALRSISTWVLSVIIYYIWPDSGAGEKLNLMSIVQGVGFCISIFGSFVYNRVVKLPFLNYSRDKVREEFQTGESADIAEPYEQV